MILKLPNLSYCAYETRGKYTWVLFEAVTNRSRLNTERNSSLVRGRGEECLHSEMTAAFVREDHTNIQLARFTHQHTEREHTEQKGLW